MIRLVTIGLFGVLSACSTAPFPPAAGDQVQGQFVINRPMTIASEKTRVFIQSGHVVDKVDVGDPVCVIESWQKQGLPQSIDADTFSVRQVAYRRGDVSSGFGVYGTTDGGMGVRFGLGGFAPEVNPSAASMMQNDYRVVQSAMVMRIVSTKQPLIYKLSCYSAQGWAASVEMPTEAQINHTLGDLAQLQLITKE
ncbi:MAG: hypothetical protein JHC38_04765 [Thiotrichales bacterium]|nr:hypothetical protein [Thiotrichales bacterium]